MINHSVSRTVYRCWRTLPEDECSYWKLEARVNANERYSCAEGNVGCIYMFVYLMVPVYLRVLPVCVVSSPLLAVTPELRTN